MLVKQRTITSKFHGSLENFENESHKRKEPKKATKRGSRWKIDLFDGLLFHRASVYFYTAFCFAF